MAFNPVQAYIQVAGMLHPAYNEEDNATQSSGSEDEGVDSGDGRFDSDAREGKG